MLTDALYISAQKVWSSNHTKYLNDNANLNLLVNIINESSSYFKNLEICIITFDFWKLKTTFFEAKAWSI